MERERASGVSERGNIASEDCPQLPNEVGLRKTLYLNDKRFFFFPFPPSPKEKCGRQAVALLNVSLSDKVALSASLRSIFIWSAHRGVQKKKKKEHCYSGLTALLLLCFHLTSTDWRWAFSGSLFKRKMEHLVIKRFIYLLPPNPNLALVQSHWRILPISGFDVYFYSWHNMFVVNTHWFSNKLVLHCWFIVDYIT